ncbi:hypothetical protein D3C73_1145490 [compost metagenome]
MNPINPLSTPSGPMNSGIPNTPPSAKPYALEPKKPAIAPPIPAPIEAIINGFLVGKLTP